MNRRFQLFCLARCNLFFIASSSYLNRHKFSGVARCWNPVAKKLQPVIRAATTVVTASCAFAGTGDTMCCQQRSRLLEPAHAFCWMLEPCGEMLQPVHPIAGISASVGAAEPSAAIGWRHRRGAELGPVWRGAAPWGDGGARWRAARDAEATGAGARCARCGRKKELSARPIRRPTRLGSDG